MLRARFVWMTLATVCVAMPGSYAWSIEGEPTGQGIPFDAEGVPSVSGGPLVQQGGVPRDAFAETTDQALQYLWLAQRGQPGTWIVHQGVDHSTGRYEETAVDLRVQVQGGSVSHDRQLSAGGEWQFNPAWKPLELEYAEGASDEEDAPRSIQRGEFQYDPVGSDGTYMYDQRRRIEITEDGFRWRDRRGNDIQYDEEGRIQSYGDANGVRVHFDLDQDGRIERVNDTHGNEVLSLEYTDQGLLESVADREGRRVEYAWNDTEDDGHRLVEVTDVLGEKWEYDYARVSERGETFDLMIERRGPGPGTELDLGYTGGNAPDTMGFGTASSGGSGSGTACVRRSGSRWVWNDGAERWEMEVDCAESQAGAPESLVASENRGGVMFSYEYHYDEGLGEYRLIRRDGAGGLEIRDYNLDGELVKHQRAGTQGVYTVERIYRDQNVRVREDADGHRTVTEFDQWANPVEIEHPDGTVEEYEWHSEYRLPTRHEEESGRITEFEYDSNGNLTRRTEAAGTTEERIVEHDYDDFGNRVLTRRHGGADAEDITESREYDDYGNLTARVDGEGHRTEFRDHDALGNPREVIDARGHEWRYEYDAAGNLERMESPAGRFMEFEYDGAGALQKLAEPGGGEVHFDYDEHGWLMTITNELGEHTRFTYDAVGRITSVMDAHGEAIQIRYTPDGRPASVTDRDGDTVKWEYEDSAVESPVALNFPNASHEFDYDVRSRRIGMAQRAEDAEDREVSFAREVGGRVTDRFEPMGRSHQYEYDALDRRTTLIDPADQRTELDYDAHDNLREVTNPRQVPIRSYEYDQNRRLVEELKPDGEAIEYDYDPNGNVTRITYPEGNTLVYDYDADNLLSEVFYFEDPADAGNPELATRHIQFDYDEAGRMTGYEDDFSSASYAYDAAGRLTETVVDYGDFELDYAYTYDATGRVESFTSPEGQTYRYEWTPEGRLREIEIPGDGVYRFHEYQGDAPTRMTLPGGTTKDIEYDGFGQMQEFVARDPAGNEILDWHYERDVIGNITERRRDSEATEYDYDILDRLTGIDGPEESNEYSYDPAGNRLSESAFRDEDGTPHDWGYDDRDRLLQRGPIEYKYDANGNRTLKRDTETGDETTYEYDAHNRLVKVEENGNTIAEYAYDPFGQRISKEVNGEKSYYLYSPDGLTAEANSSGDVHTSYGWKPDSLWGTDPLFIRQDGEYGYYLKDQLFTPWMVVSSSGSILWQADYDAFGEARILTSEIKNNLRFPGQYEDAETDGYYNLNRYYSSTLARYSRGDPIGLWGGISLYVYVGGNPVNFFDPYGLHTWGFHGNVNIGLGKGVTGRIGVVVDGQGNVAVQIGGGAGGTRPQFTGSFTTTYTNTDHVTDLQGVGGQTGANVSAGVAGLGGGAIVGKCEDGDAYGGGYTEFSLGPGAPGVVSYATYDSNFWQFNPLEMWNRFRGWFSPED